MPIELGRLVSDIQPPRTVLLFGAGSSIPSGAPSVAALQSHFDMIFGVSAGSYNIAEQTGIIEQRTKDRKRLIRELQSKFRQLSATGAVLNLPLYRWKSIFTTNYDEIIEQSYSRSGVGLRVYSTNFDFGMNDDPSILELFKLHGTISKDISIGDHSRIILTESDYDYTEDYREQLFERLKSDIGSGHLVIIGHSLNDDDIRSVTNRAVSLKARHGLSCRISLLMYSRDDGRAALFESRGIEVSFGGLDDFFAKMAEAVEPNLPFATSDDPLDKVVSLRPSTVDVRHAILHENPNVNAMYNGWPATFGDISAGLTFERTIVNEVANCINDSATRISIILGPSGVGKTTAARKALAVLSERGLAVWQHKSDQTFLPTRWREMAHKLLERSSVGVLLIDDAHVELSKINTLVEDLDQDGIESLKFILVSTNHNWGHRVKSHIIFKYSKVFYLNKISPPEIDSLLDLLDRKPQLRALVEADFIGYSRPEKRRRLVQRCGSDMFVCLKNIFSSESFDNIILREYAELDSILQDIYKTVAAMESVGVHVHRQLVVRMLGIRADKISAILSGLEDIIHENDEESGSGIYAWTGRHKVIMDIVAEHKYFNASQKFEFFSRVIDNIRPTYNIEIKTIRDLCSVDTGIRCISDLKLQNILLRKLISVAPGERVPRHRLIRNLIELGHFDAAETEIKIFSSDFKIDAPTTRYKIKLVLDRAVRTKGIMTEDRIAILGKAESLAKSAAKKYKNVKGIVAVYCEVGIEIAKLTGDHVVYDTAIAHLRDAEEYTGDSDFGRMVARFERRMVGIQAEPSEAELDEIIDL